jgi:hypothetical protein
MFFRVKISSAYWGCLRFSPMRKGWWENYFFDTEGRLDEYDYWVVLGDMDSRESAICSIDRIFLVVFEPPEIKRGYTDDFLTQFSAVFTWRSSIKHNRLIITPPPLPAMVSPHFSGRDGERTLYDSLKDYDQLKSIPSIEKQKVISTVCSNKRHTSIQAKRIELTNYLEDALSEYGIDVYGYPRNYIADKWDALYPYKYHIAIENSAHPNYWTEKVSDAFLAYSYPFYYGCTKLEQFFPQKSFTYIDINDRERTLSIIRKAIKEEYHRKYAEHIREARNLVLDKYNIFPYLVSQLNKIGKGTGIRKRITISPETTTNIPLTQRAISRLLPLNSTRRAIAKSMRDRILRIVVTTLACNIGYLVFAL